MSDDVRLAARLWLPEDAESDPVPLVLEHLPYRLRDGTIARDEIVHPYLAGHGYACLRTDMRGNGDSDGLMADEYTEREWLDACEVIAWARAQPWCSGTAGMTGISWGGFNALQVAALRPEGLRAVVVNCTTVDRFADDIHFKGGSLLGENVGWAAQMLAYSLRPPDPIAREDWREVWLHRLENMPFLAREWIGRQRRDDYWRHGSICKDYAAVEAAVLIFQGWHDGYRNTPAHLLANVPGTKAVWGPWIHKYPHYSGPEPRIGYLQAMLRHFDHHLKGIQTGVDADPPARAWLMDTIEPARWHSERPGRWIAGDWPGPDECVLHLTDGGLADEVGPLDGRVASPADCGAASGEYFPFAYGPEFPDEQGYDDARSLCFDTEPLAEPIDLVGAPHLDLTLFCDRPLGQCVVRVCAVAPDGTSAFVTMGLLNLTHRDGSASPRLVEPDEPVSCRITLDQIAQRVPAGHCLRVAISTALWPFVWPSPDPVRLRLTQGTLRLRTRPLATDDECAFGPPEGSPPWAHDVLHEPSMTRETETLADGSVVTTILIDNGEMRDAADGLLQASSVREVWSIHPDDPLCASVDIEWRQRGGRDDWRWSTVSRMRMTSERENFHIVASLAVREGATLLFRRGWDERIPRLYV